MSEVPLYVEHLTQDAVDWERGGTWAGTDDHLLGALAAVRR